MEFNQLPCVYFPTQVLMVDDNVSFLENIRLTIDDYQNVTLFSNPISALQLLQDYQSKFNNLDLMKNFDCDELDEENVLSIDYGKIPELLNDTKEISVLIVDYSMPEINGVEFFKQVKSLKTKKIMLTGEADNQIAVNAFNEGLIDKFIVKGGSRVNENLGKYVNELKFNYFIDAQINQIISINSPVKKSSTYLKLALNWINEFSINRFYQINQNGSLIGTDKNNNIRCFYLLTNNCFDEFLDIAGSQDASQSLLDQLANRISMPVFTTNESFKIPVHEWSNVFHPVEHFFEFDSEKYYYCYKKL